MARRRRTRRGLKWLGTVLCALLLLGYVPVALHYQVLAAINRGDDWIDVAVLGGAVHTVLILSPGSARAEIRTMCRLERAGQAIIWVPQWTARVIAEGPPGTRVYDLYLPLWIPFLLVAVPTLLLWLRDRRPIPAHCCQRCGYDLTGNVSGRCPECGTATRPAGK